MKVILILYTLLTAGLCQINLGSFFLHPAGPGGWDLGLGQSANILGFGGDRGLNVAGRPEGVEVKSGGGALIGNERVGVDSGVGVKQQGIDVGSQLQFGNNPNPMHPGGQFGNFLENIKNFFAHLVPTPAQPSFIPAPTALPPTHATLRPHFGTEGQLSGGEVFPSESSEWGTDALHSIDGETRLETTEDKETQTTEDIFEQATEKPRQLPGLIEFMRRM